MKNPLDRLRAVAAGCGVATAVLLFILILPHGVTENTAALEAIGWTLTKVLGAVALGAGMLVVGLTPVMTHLEKVLAKQEALERALEKDSAERPVLVEYEAPAALTEHNLE